MKKLQLLWIEVNKETLPLSLSLSLSPPFNLSLSLLLSTSPSLSSFQPLTLSLSLSLLLPTSLSLSLSLVHLQIRYTSPYFHLKGSIRHTPSLHIFFSLHPFLPSFLPSAPSFFISPLLPSFSPSPSILIQISSPSHPR